MIKILSKNLNNILPSKVLLLFFIIFNTSIYPNTGKVPNYEYTYINFSYSNISLKYMREGVICSGIYQGKYFCKFYETKEIPIDKRNAIQQYIVREKIWDLDTSYNNDRIILGSLSQCFIISNSNVSKFKRILIHSCYNPKTDSLLVYLNDLLPKSEKRRMNLLNYRYVKTLNFPECK